MGKIVDFFPTPGGATQWGCANTKENVWRIHTDATRTDVLEQRESVVVKWGVAVRRRGES